MATVCFRAVSFPPLSVVARLPVASQLGFLEPLVNDSRFMSLYAMSKVVCRASDPVVCSECGPSPARDSLYLPENQLE